MVPVCDRLAVAAWQLAEEVAAGAEIPFELMEQGRASAPLRRMASAPGQKKGVLVPPTQQLSTSAAVDAQTPMCPRLRSRVPPGGRGLDVDGPRATSSWAEDREHHPRVYADATGEWRPAALDELAARASPTSDRDEAFAGAVLATTDDDCFGDRCDPPIRRSRSRR
jgi:hypothetical protein